MNDNNEQIEQPIIDEKKELEIVKLKLEAKKLEAEIIHLKRSLLKNPQYLAPIISIIAVTITIIYTFYSGLWDVKMAKLENTKLVLQIDIDKFQKQKDTLSKQVLEIELQKTNLIQQNKKLKSQFELANQKYKEIFGKYSSQKEEIAKELLEIDNLISSDKCKEAFEKLRAIIVKLKNWENRVHDPFSFSEDFN